MRTATLWIQVPFCLAQVLPSHTQRYAVSMWYFDSKEKSKAEERVACSADAVAKERKRIQKEINSFENKHQAKALVSSDAGAASAPASSNRTATPASSNRTATSSSNRTAASSEPALPASTPREMSQSPQMLDEVDLDALD